MSVRIAILIMGAGCRGRGRSGGASGLLDPEDPSISADAKDEGADSLLEGLADSRLGGQENLNHGLRAKQESEAPMAYNLLNS